MEFALSVRIIKPMVHTMGYTYSVIIDIDSMASIPI